jgi:excisionase family DNA binding protein
LRTDNFDPLAYIESAFLDTRTQAETEDSEPAEHGFASIPSITDYIALGRAIDDAASDIESLPRVEAAPRGKFRKTVMSAPRPRRSKTTAADADPVMDSDLHSVWQTLPKSVEFLCSFYDDAVTANYYRGEFKESRQDLIRRLLDPELSLEETSRLLGVCPATVRRYTNRGWLAHHRTGGGQRRFRLSDIVKFVDEHGRFPQE